MESEAQVLLVHGGNRSGKTLACAAKFAKFAFDNPGAVMFVVARNWDHIGNVVWKVLFGSDSPQIPDDEIEYFFWENRVEHWFSKVVLKNGTVIKAIPSTGEIQAGDAVDFAWIDEDLKSDFSVGELQSRLVDRKGQLVWSFLPGPTLADVHPSIVRLMSERGTECCRLSMFDNPYVSEKEKKDRASYWSGSEYAVRAEGEFSVT